MVKLIAVFSLLFTLALTAFSASAQIPIHYTLIKDGNVSLAVYDADGRMQRTIMNALPHKAGAYTASWDGLDAAGKPVPPGNYTWKLLQSPGLQAEYLLSIGTSFRDLHWNSQHAGPHVLAVASDDIYVGGSPEGSPLMNKIGLDGAYKWAMPNIAQATNIDTTYMNDRLYLLHSHGIVYVRKADDGSGVTSFNTLAPVRSYDFTAPGAPVAPRHIAVPLAAYSKERGFGWETIDGMTAETHAGKDALTSTFHGTSALKANTFILDIPNGTYLIRIHAGDAAEATGAFYCISQGETPMQKRFGPLKAGEFVSDLAPERYNTPRPCQVTDGQLKLTFSVTGKAPEHWAINGIEILTMPQRMDTRDGELVTVYPAVDMLAWFNPANGQLLQQVTLPSPQDVAINAPGSILAISGDTVVSLTRQDPLPHVRISGLIAPKRLSIDPVNGDIFIVESGESQQIKRFDKAFTLKNVYGRKGGRLQGLYHAEDFRAVANVESDGKGGFVIIEGDAAPRRTAHFNRNGKLLKEWYGGQLFYTNFDADPENPNYVWFDSHWGWVVQAEVDYEKKTWKPRATYYFNNLADGLIPNEHNNTPGWQVRRHGGETYLITEIGTPGVLRVDEANGRLVPVMASQLHLSPKSTVPLIKTIFDKDPRAPWRSLVWTDRNGDGMPQPEEALLSKYDAWASWRSLPGFRYFDITRNTKTLDYEVAFHDPLTWQGKVPLYPSLDERAPISLAGTEIRSNAADLRKPGAADYWQDEQGNHYAILMDGGDDYRAVSTYPPSHGYAWPANLVAATRVVKWSPDGKLLWEVGPHAARFGNPRGQLHYPTRIAGMVHGCIGIAEKIVQPCEFWTVDGLYVGGLFDRRSDDGLPDRVYAWWRGDQNAGEEFTNRALLQYDMLIGGDLVTRPNGDILYFGAGWNNIPVYKITGWDEITRQQGVAVVTTPATPTTSTGNGLQATYFAGSDLTGVPSLEKREAQVWFGDGQKPRPWPDSPVTKEPFSVRWSGYVEPRYSEDYTVAFYLYRPRGVNAGVRVWLDGTLLIDNWDGAKGNRSFAQPIHLMAGTRYPIKIEWHGDNATVEAHLSWESISQPIEHIPTSQLYPAP